MASPSGGTKTRKATIVNFAPDRQVHIAEEIAGQLRVGAVERVGDLYEQFKEVWQGVDSSQITSAGDLTTEQNEKFGGLLWIVGEMRSQINDVLFLSEHAQEGYVPPNQRRAHEYDTRG